MEATAVVIEKERRTRELGQALGVMFLEQEGQRQEEGSSWNHRALGDCQVQPRCYRWSERGWAATCPASLHAL